MNRTPSLLPNGTLVHHKDAYLHGIWGTGTVLQSTEGQHRGKRIVLYRVRFALCEEDMAMGFTEEDVTITVTDAQIEVVDNKNA